MIRAHPRNTPGAHTCTRILKKNRISETRYTFLERRSMGVIRETFFSHLFLVQKRLGGWIPIIDLSRLNKFVICPHYKMETLESITLSLKKGDLVTSLDLQDANFHFMILVGISHSLSLGKSFSFRLYNLV